MLRLLSLTLMLVGLLSTPCLAQWPSWADRAFGDRPSWRSEREPQPWQRPSPHSSPTAPLVADGGARPEFTPLAPETIAFQHDYPVSSIVISTADRKLFYVLPGGQAYAYPISVGREGFSWTGTEAISRKQAWPDWYPPKEMRERDPKLPEKMTGGCPQSARGHGSLSRFHPLSHPRHQRREIHWPSPILRLFPDDECVRHASRGAGRCGNARNSRFLVA